MKGLGYVESLLSYTKLIKGRLYQRGILPARPEKLKVFTTDRCNFSCFYCSRNLADNSRYTENLYKDDSEFTLKNLEYLIEKYPSIRRIEFIGVGEPFLVKDIIPMAKFSKEMKKRVSVITNASLLHHYWGQLAPYFDRISISLHGLSAGELDSVAKVKGKVFERFVANVQHLVQEEYELSPAMEILATVVVLKSDMERIRQAAEFCLTNKIPTLALQNFEPFGAEASHLCIFEDEIEIIQYFDELVDEFRGKLNIKLPVLIKRDEKDLNWGCHSFFNYLRVDGLGQVSGCGRQMVPLAKNGNFYEEGDVFQNNYFLTMRDKFRTRKGLPECCRYCPEAQ